eukprot:CAMPEP_0179843270 /NCGR_PEP_ID=MMETSP0982-20121206/3608_1 /TAXON_ID=483367 /ORGANISM="non described non described, Strain CCMP 2436" /LENGTH=198 /DNA_ID=CAMNT_0021727673 /DNA_START=2192 /DNA_END=2788 /DNA_ORIENTATION=+
MADLSSPVFSPAPSLCCAEVVASPIPTDMSCDSVSADVFASLSTFSPIPSPKRPMPASAATNSSPSPSVAVGPDAAATSCAESGATVPGSCGKGALGTPCASCEGALGAPSTLARSRGGTGGESISTPPTFVGLSGLTALTTVRATGAVIDLGRAAIAARLAACICMFASAAAPRLGTGSDASARIPPRAIRSAVRSA